MSVITTSGTNSTDIRITRFASWVSLVASSVILGIKFLGYYLTGSNAIYSDALESSVNVAGAVVALTALRIAAQPADRDHPYGHGKVEYFSAAFEGGLLVFAAFMILTKSIAALISGAELRELGLGLFLTAVAAVGNALLGLFLLQTGRRHSSVALVASGKHVLSDVWTTAGAALGLFLVRLTSVPRIDPLIALLLGLYIASTGYGLVKHSAGGLMDAEDKQVISKIASLFTKHLFPGIIRIHSTRIIRSGRIHHIDCHIVVPEFWSTAKTHTETERYERSILDDYGTDSEIHFHIDPCRQSYCKVCDYDDCPIRRHPFEHRTTFTLEELTSPTELPEFRGNRLRS